MQRSTTAHRSNPQPRGRAIALATLAACLTLTCHTAAAEAARRASCGGIPATIVAGRTEVVIVGTPGDDVIVGNRLDNVIQAGEGDDVICGNGGDDQIFGEGGRDLIFGDNGADLLDGGAETDRIFGGGGDDVIVGGAGDDELDGARGDDRFVWNPGDGSDRIEDRSGRADVLQVNGSGSAERIDVVAADGRLSVRRDVGNVVLDADEIEQVQIAVLGGADTVNVGDLSDTTVDTVAIDLAGPGGADDGQVDGVTVSATNEADEVLAAGAPGLVTASGLAATVEVIGAATEDTLSLLGLGGDDTLDASEVAADALEVRLFGGLGDDVLVGSQGRDTAIGGDGNDLALLRAGDDVFVWNPGDDDDTVEGQGGFDVLQMNGSNAPEVVDLSAIGPRVRFFRNVANVTMDLDDVEEVLFRALGGADTVVVNDLSGTDLAQVTVDLSATPGEQNDDAQPDTIVTQGTGGDDVALVVGVGTEASVLGLAAQIDIGGAHALDRLVVNMLAGDDVVEASGLAADAIDLTADGGADDDVLIGGDGADVLLGGPGDDVLLGGPGIDVLDGGTGDNVVIQ